MSEVEVKILKNELTDIDELTPFQGKLKTLSRKNANKLKKTMIDEGFSFTIHVWENGGVKYIIDGHQRVSVLKGMRRDGVTIPKLPCAYVKAETYHDAKKLVLLAVSQYGKLDKQGFEEFVHNEDFNMDDFDFPDIDDKFFDDIEQPEPEDKDPLIEKEEYLIVIECDDEPHQSDLFEQLKESGVKCKIM